MTERLEQAGLAALDLAAKAIFELKATDDGMSAGQSAKILGSAIFRQLSELEGEKAVADFACRVADALATGAWR